MLFWLNDLQHNKSSFIRLLSSIGNRPFFTNNRHFHLSWILHLVLDLLGDHEREIIHKFVGHLITLHNHPKFSSGLQRICFLNTFKSHREIFEIPDTFEIAFQNLPTCAWTSSADSITSLDDR